MYGVSSKLGRGGGRGGGGGPRNRNSFPPPPPHRAIPATGRLSLVASSTGPRHRTTTTATATARAPQAVEETFSLLPGKSPLAFAMIIRLAPDLVDEIRRLEAQGCTARIKFDSIANNTIGNVIDVGGKEFKFTWSPEFGDLCDIYEERQSGEDGNGLLVESGCAWRKVNVQRILDESTKNHVKMRSEEAERKTRSRKAIVLDPGNPDMKKQIGQLVAVESNPWRAYKPKKEPPFKKRKVDPPQVSVGGPPKSTFRPRLASTVAEKGRRSASPLPSPPEQSAAPASPVGTVNLTKSHATNEDVTPIKVKCKKNVANTEKDIPKRATSDAGETLGHKTNSVGNPVDLQSMLITLLKEHRKGMRLKDLEKAVGDVIPNSAKKIEPIIKKIATFQAPGRYFLKPGVELESFKKPSSESGSSPEDNHHQTPDPENHDRTSVPVVSFLEKIPTGELGEQAQPDSKLGDQSDILASVGVQLDSPDLFGEKKVSDNSEGQAGSSSDSGSDSDSDSDSSDSGSDSGSHSRSRSRSRSRSPVGSGSGSSSDSDSDASSNSKEGSDEDVDIITSDDDKDAKQNLQAAELGMSSSPIPCHIDDERPIQDGVDEVKDGDGSDAVDIEGHGSDAVDIEGHGSDAIDIESHGSDGVDIEKDLPDDGQEVQMAVNNTSVPNKESRKPAGGTKLFLSNHDELQERQTFIGNLFDDTENVIKDNFRHEQSDSSERKSKSKSKRGPDPKRFDEKSEQAKRLKVESLTQPPITEVKDSQFSENLQTWSPDRVVEDSYNGSSRQMINKTNRKGNANIGAQRNQTMKSGSDFQQSSHKSALAKAPDTAERSSVKYTESSEHGHKFSEKSFHLPEDFPAQKEKSSRDTPKEDSSMKEKKFSRNLKDGAGGKHSIASESYYRKHGEMVGKVKESLSFPSAHTGSSPKDDNRMSLEKYPVSGGGGFLQRELSDLELGELREPLLEETVVKKQFERKNSFRSSENKTSTSENCNLDLGKGKLVGKATFDLGKPSPSNLSVGVKRTPEHNVEDLTRSYTKVGQSQSLHYSRADNAEVGSQCNRLVDASSKSWQNGNGMKPGVSIEGYGESHRKVPNSALQQHDSKGGQVSHSIKESKTHTSNTMADLINGGKDANLFEGNNGGRKKRESSSDEDSSSYLKYEKDAPELRGPIKDLLQYKEYVQEYRDKYDSYCSLNKILESYRNEFQKLGKDLDFAKGRDMERYYKVMGQLRESYRQCGTRHKKLKRIFVVLHEELEHLKQRIKDFARAYAKD